jgi:hypothetical protein
MAGDAMTAAVAVLYRRDYPYMKGPLTFARQRPTTTTL